MVLFAIKPDAAGSLAIVAMPRVVAPRRHVVREVLAFMAMWVGVGVLEEGGSVTGGSHHDEREYKQE